ncbi:S1 RNA-binding domain-containing protein, partial [Patescibacteria group bacterium]|nr:S1 RNA-binding domain-containing protein [Patescibacteria group bacterium]
KTINAIKDDTGVEEISIEDDGTIFITGKDGSAEKAEARIKDITRVFKIGEKLDVTITKVADFGAFAKLNDANEGLIHISEIAPFRVEKITDILKEGDKVPVVIKEVDEKDRINLSIKQRDPDFAKNKAPKQIEK